MQINILGIEVSTSSAKAVLFSWESQTILDLVSVPYTDDISNVVQQDPQGIYDTVVKCINKLQYNNRSVIDAISLSTTWHSLLLLNEQRDPITRIMTWANTDAACTAQEYREDGSFSNLFYGKTGCMVHSAYPIWKYIHIKKYQPELAYKAKYLSSQHEYMFEKLTGDSTVSKTIASGTGFLNINTLEWDNELLNLAGVSRAQLSPLKEPTYYAPLCKKAAESLKLPEGIPVVLGGADGALNQIGAGAIEEGIMTLSVGTSGAIRMSCLQPTLAEHPSTWCYYLAEGKRIAGAATSGAGNCVDWLLRKGNYTYDGLEKMVKNIDIIKAPYFLPFLYGERCPGWEDGRTGGFYNLNGRHDMGDLYYAVLEGILFNLYHCYKILSDVTQPPNEIRVSGGITRSPIWLALAANIFGREIVVSKVEHESVLGGIILALKSAGIIQNLSQYKPDKGIKIYPDEKMSSIYKERFKTYIEMYKNNK